MTDRKQNRCPETETGLMLYIYGESPDARTFEAHLESCDACRAELELHKATLQQFRKAAPDNAFIDLKAAYESATRPTFVQKLLQWWRPIAAATVAAVLIAGVYTISIRTKAPKKEIASGAAYELDGMENTLQEIAYVNPADLNRQNITTEASGKETDEHMDRLDDMSNELSDIKSDLTTF